MIKLYVMAYTMSWKEWKETVEHARELALSLGETVLIKTLNSEGAKKYVRQKKDDDGA